jgi:hypothetical protein
MHFIELKTETTPQCLRWAMESLLKLENATKPSAFVGLWSLLFKQATENQHTEKQSAN